MVTYKLQFQQRRISSVSELLVENFSIWPIYCYSWPQTYNIFYSTYNLKLKGESSVSLSCIFTSEPSC